MLDHILILPQTDEQLFRVKMGSQTILLFLRLMK
nr:MAG TPA: hypothetical protein [Bacteriophage sp.]